mmetsp:Transcript_274/g.535  ORF Transcript_274/g.535 Transcript_274/m.535 type:complete len:201 (+) Transcript_274:489-1091(+)
MDWETRTADAAAFSRTTFSSTAKSSSSGCNNDATWSLPPTYGTSLPREAAIPSSTSSSSSTPSHRKGSSSSRVRFGPRAAAMVGSLVEASMRAESSSERSFSMVWRASSSSIMTMGRSCEEEEDVVVGASMSMASLSLFASLPSGGTMGGISDGGFCGWSVPMMVPVSVTSGISGGGGGLLLLLFMLVDCYGALSVVSLP